MNASQVQLKKKKKIQTKLLTFNTFNVISSYPKSLIIPLLIKLSIGKES